MIYTSKKITPEQQSLLDGNNPHQYPAGRESSEDKQGIRAESSLGERISAAGQDVDLSPTEAQKAAGNYKKGHVQVGTFDVTIENPAGSKRSGTDAEGKYFVTKGNNMVGYVTPENLAKVVDMLSREPFNLTVLEKSKLTEVSDRGSQPNASDKDGLRFRFAESSEDFDSMRDRAVAEKGIVTPDLSEREIRVVELERHDFEGARPINEAKAWAKENLAGTHTLTDSEGNNIEYEISRRTIDKYLSPSAIEKSDNLGIHLAVLKALPEVIGESVEGEVHPDYLKGADGKRDPENGYNPDTLINRFYGAVWLEGGVYRVKTTIKDTRKNKLAPVPHSYEVTEIELLPEDSSSEMEPTVSPNITGVPHGTAKLLKGVEKSYDPGVKLLDSSEGKMRERGVDVENVDEESLWRRPWGWARRWQERRKAESERRRDAREGAIAYRAVWHRGGDKSGCLGT